MRLLLAFVSIYFISSAAFAQIYNTSVTSATAGSGRAAVDIGEASFLNPATLVHQPNHQFLISEAKNELAASLSENNREVIFPASLGFVQKRTEGYPDPVMTDMRLTLAEPFNGQAAFGITGHYYQVHDLNDDYQQANVDMGLIYTPLSNWGLGVVGYNMMGGRAEMPKAYQLQQTTGFGVNWLYRPTMRFRLDTVTGPNNNFSKMARMLGYENYFNKWTVGRIGYQEDTYNEKTYASVGLGLDLPKFTLNYAFFSELPRNSTERHSIDLGLKF